MNLPKELTTVTPLSKNIALVIFTLLPIGAFLMGMKYQRMLTGYVPPAANEQTSCTKEAKLCPDGSTVGRSGPDCEFVPCPAVQDSLTCGGIQGKICPTGYECRYEGKHSDASGTCVSIKMPR